MGFVLWIIALAATAIGVILANFVISLDIINAPEIISALVWFLISWISYMAGRKVEDESWFKLLSINFLITWIFCTVGAIVGELVWELIETGGIQVVLDNMVSVFFGILPLTIGPTAAMSLGLRD